MVIQVDTYYPLFAVKMPKHRDDADLSFLNGLLPCSPTLQEHRHKSNKYRAKYEVELFHYYKQNCSILAYIHTIHHYL